MVTQWINKQGLSFYKADILMKEMDNKQNVVGNKQEQNKE